MVEENIVEDIQSMIEMLKESDAPLDLNWVCGYCGNMFNRSEVPIMFHIESCG